MAVEDFMETEVGVTAAVTAAVLSPTVRGVLRRGAVYSLAGAMKLGDLVVGGVSRVAGGVSAAASSAQDAAAEGEAEETGGAPAAAPRTRRRPPATGGQAEAGPAT